MQKNNVKIIGGGKTYYLMGNQSACMFLEYFKFSFFLASGTYLLCQFNGKE